MSGIVQRDGFEQAPAAYLVTDHHGIISDANPDATRLLNRPYRRLIGRPLTAFVTPEERAIFRRMLGRIGFGGRAHLPLRVRPFGGSPIEAQVTANARSERRRPPRSTGRVYWLLREDSSHTDPDLL